MSSPACSSPSWAGGAPLLRVPRAHSQLLRCPAWVAAAAPVSRVKNLLSPPFPTTCLEAALPFTRPFAVCPGSCSLPQALGYCLFQMCPPASSPDFSAGDLLARGFWCFVHLSLTCPMNLGSQGRCCVSVGMNRYTDGSRMTRLPLGPPVP